MKLYYIILLIFVLSCQNNQTDHKENIIAEDDVQIEIKIEDVKDSIPDEIEDATELFTTCTKEEINELKDFLSNYLNPQGLDLVTDALEIYSTVDTDTAMKDFYFNSLPQVSRTLNAAFYKFKDDYDEEDEWDCVEDWNAGIGKCIPFMIYIIDNHFDGAEGYKYTSALLEKSESTLGKADETFFEAKINCWGTYSAAYSSLHSEQIACDISTSTYGGGFHYNALKSVIKADNVSNLFKEDLEKLAKFILSEEEIITFGYSKNDVYNEIEQILNLRDSMKYNLSKVENLKLFIDTTSRKLYFNCLDGSCPP